MTRSDLPQTGRFLAFDDVDGLRFEELRPGVNHSAAASTPRS